MANSSVNFCSVQKGTNANALGPIVLTLIKLQTHIMIKIKFIIINLIYNQFTIAGIVTFLLIMCITNYAIKDPTKGTGGLFSVVGEPVATLTSAILLTCLILAQLGLKNEEIQPLSWNVSNNIKQLHHKVITQKSFTYELKPAFGYLTGCSKGFYYDISAKMNHRILSLEETKEFLNKYDCDNDRFPILAIQHISTLGAVGAFNFYPFTNLACDPK